MVDATALATALVATHSYKPASSLASPTIVRFPPTIVALLFSDNSPSTYSSVKRLTIPYSIIH